MAINKTFPAAKAEIKEGYEFDPNATYHELVIRTDWLKHKDEAYHEYRRQWDYIPRNKIETDFPIHLDIETTNLCNLQCPMCPRTIHIQNDEFSEIGRMTREQYKKIIDEAAACGVKSIKLNYLGEPLAHKDVVWQVAYAKQQGVIDVMMNSNGSLLKKDLGKQLLEAGLDHLFISFDAVSPDLFEQQRTGTTIGKVIDNLYHFCKLRNERYPGTHIRVSMVMYKDPKWAEQFEALKVMWKTMVDDIGYGFYVERDTNKMQEYPPVEGFYCAQPFQRMFLKYNGNVTICCVDDKDELVVGNWHKQELKDIWQGQEYKEIRRMHAEGNYYNIPMCRKCYLPHSE